MKPERVPVALEGYPFIAFCAFVTLLSAILGYAVLTLVLLVATTFVLMFFRDPERHIPVEEQALVAPADGKVIVVERVVDRRFSPDEMLKIAIFMNVFNVHVNRVPCSARVERVQHVPGAFIAADSDTAHLKNEYCAVTAVTPGGARLTWVQIAGLVARRIVCRLEPGDQVVKGARFGLIRFGSRVDLYLPATANPVIQVGQKVTAGETILAYLG